MPARPGGDPRRARGAPRRGSSARRSIVRQRGTRAAAEQRLRRRQAERRSSSACGAARVLGRGQRRQRLVDDARRRVEIAERRRRHPRFARRSEANSAVSVSHDRSRASRPTSATRSRPTGDGQRRIERRPRIARGHPDGIRTSASRAGSRGHERSGAKTRQMLQRVALGQARFNLPGLTADARGAASAGSSWRASPPSIGWSRSSACCRPSRASTICSRACASSTRAAAAGTREAIVLLPAAPELGDAVAHAVRLAGGQLFTGAASTSCSFARRARRSATTSTALGEGPAT